MILRQKRDEVGASSRFGKYLLEGYLLRRVEYKTHSFNEYLYYTPWEKTCVTKL